MTDDRATPPTNLEYDQPGPKGGNVPHPGITVYTLTDSEADTIGEVLADLANTIKEPSYRAEVVKLAMRFGAYEDDDE
jgi:hypothetical protein